MPMPNMPRRMTTNDDVVVRVRSAIAEVYADAVTKETPPQRFARHLLMVMREEHLYFVARIDGVPDPKPSRS